jgi:hypothetical protein
MNNDHLFAEIANKSQSVEGLLNDFFGFLHRRTDFYVEINATAESAKKKYAMGFPKGAAESMVLTAFHKYPMKEYEEPILKESAPVPSKSTQKPSVSREVPVKPVVVDGKQIPIGNGGVADNYFWTQTLKDITVYIDVPKETTSKQIKCQIQKDSLQVLVGDRTIVDGKFEEPVNSSESVWTLNRASGNGSSGNESQIIVVIEKLRETWWKHVIVGHPEIDTTKVMIL